MLLKSDSERSTPVKFEYPKSIPVKSILDRFALVPERLTPVPDAPPENTVVRSNNAPDKLEFEKFTPAKLVPRKSTPDKSVLDRLAPVPERLTPSPSNENTVVLSNLAPDNPEGKYNPKFTPAKFTPRKSTSSANSPFELENVLLIKFAPITPLLKIVVSETVKLVAPKYTPVKFAPSN